jgi:hypothetical protein
MQFSPDLAFVVWSCETAEQLDQNVTSGLTAVRQTHDIGHEDKHTHESRTTDLFVLEQLETWRRCEILRLWPTK